jgi:hypothetical protein
MTMTAVATVDPAQQIAVTRIAPSGVPVDLTVPTAFGEHRWYGNARFEGPRTARQFYFAPAGEHAAIPSKILPGAREQRMPMLGHDAVVYEAADRSDSALVFAGPYHEATTWFGGPAPDLIALTSLLGMFRFTDSAQGASLTPLSNLLLQQTDVALIGRSATSMLMVRPSADMLPTLPDWAGFALPGGELWRAGRSLDPAEAAMVAGTPHEWRYLLAGTTAAMDLVFLGPESGNLATGLDEGQVVRALAGLTARWAG